MPSIRLKSSIIIESNTSNKHVTRNITCEELFACEYLEFVCKNCDVEVDILSHSRKKSARNSETSHMKMRASME